MLSIEACRAAEPNLSGLTDEEVLRIRDAMYELAQLAFEDFIKQSGSNNPAGVVLQPKKGGIV